MPSFYFLKDGTDGVPYLCKSSLQVNALETLTGNAEDECFAEGVEQLHIEFGIDMDDPTDGIANLYTSTPFLTLSTSPNVLSTNAADKAISARIYLLMRAARELQDYNNDKTYVLGTLNVNGGAAFNDGFYRRVFSTTVTLRNPRTLVLFDY